MALVQIYVGMSSCHSYLPIKTVEGGTEEGREEGKEGGREGREGGKERERENIHVSVWKGHGCG